MKKLNMLLISLATLLYFGSIPLLAQRGHGGGGGQPGGNPGMSGMHGGPMGSQAGQGSQHSEMGQPGMGHPQSGQEGRMGGREEHGRAGSHPEHGSMTGRRTVADHLAQNEKLSGKLGGLLPAGTNLQQSAAGFKNIGEFVSAAHVSHNLGIPFDQLRARISSGKSLGDAIHELNPNVDQKAEVKKAKNQANKDLKESGS